MNQTPQAYMVVNKMNILCEISGHDWREGKRKYISYGSDYIERICRRCGKEISEENKEAEEIEKFLCVLLGHKYYNIWTGEMCARCGYSNHISQGHW